MKNETIEDVLERRKEIEKSLERQMPELRKKHSEKEIDFYKAILARDRPCPYRDNEKGFCNIYEHECHTSKLKLMFPAFGYWCEVTQKIHYELANDAKERGLE